MTLLLFLFFCTLNRPTFEKWEHFDPLFIQLFLGSLGHFINWDPSQESFNFKQMKHLRFKSLFFIKLEDTIHILDKVNGLQFTKTK